jgi:hypothetical protein
MSIRSLVVHIGFTPSKVAVLARARIPPMLVPPIQSKIL